MKINLVGNLNYLKSQRGNRPTGWTENGRDICRKEAIARLEAAIAKGHRVYKMGEPCPTWDPVDGKCRCVEFDYDPIAMG